MGDVGQTHISGGKAIDTGVHNSEIVRGGGGGGLN